jgi:hypothetical protein
MSDDITASEESKADTSEKARTISTSQVQKEFNDMGREEKNAHTLAYLRRGMRKEDSTLLTVQQDHPKGTESEERDWGHVTVASDASDMAWETIMSTEELDSYFDADDELPSRGEER